MYIYCMQPMAMRLSYIIPVITLLALNYLSLNLQEQMEIGALFQMEYAVISN